MGDDAWARHDMAIRTGWTWARIPANRGEALGQAGRGEAAAAREGAIANRNPFEVDALRGRHERVALVDRVRRGRYVPASATGADVTVDGSG